MKREFLKELGLTDEQIDKIMAENGKDIEKYKALAETKEAELKQVKQQLEEANAQIEKFKDMDIESIKAAAEDYKQKYEKAKEEAQKEIEQIKFNYAIEKALTEAKARNVKAVKALLDLDNLKLTDDKILGLDEQLEKIKEENDFLFEVEKKEKVPTIVRPGGSNELEGITKEQFNKMGYLERVKLKQKNKSLYEKLSKEE